MLDGDELVALLPRVHEGHVQADFEFLRASNVALSTVSHNTPLYRGVTWRVLLRRLGRIHRRLFEAWGRQDNPRLLVCGLAEMEVEGNVHIEGIPPQRLGNVRQSHRSALRDS